jgi:peptide/nickel transport system permease protein/oligopeptide transport system permease protein
MKLPNRSRQIAEEFEKRQQEQENKQQESKQQANREYLKSQIAEEETFFTLIRRLARENKLAVVSFFVILLIILGAVLAPVLAPYSFSDMDLLHRLNPPGAQHLLGTDEAGRDILTRLLYGARVSLLTGVVPTVMSMVIGAILGVISGSYGGWLDALIMRLADIMLAFPSMLLAMVIMYMLGDGLINVFLTLALVNWASVARIVRAQALQLKKTEYVEAARVIGVSRTKIMFRHLLPNCLPTLIVLFTLNVPSAILTESSLSFLGLGLQPPAASWGLMVNAGRQYLYMAPWVSLVPGAAIMVCVLAFNFLGDGLRDVLDPHLRK